MARVGSSPQPVLVEFPKPWLAIVRLNRPEAANALSIVIRRALVETFRQLSEDDRISVVILTGSGRAFCAGLDLREVGAGKDALSSDVDLDPVVAVRNFRGIVIGAINGAAYTGGLELALGCDILIAGQSARFADTHARMGVLPGWQLSQRLGRIIGIQRAKQMSFSGEPIDSRRAEKWGLVNEVVSDDDLLDHTIELAHAIARADRAMLIVYKGLIDGGHAVSLQEGLALECSTSAAHNSSLAESILRQRSTRLQQLGSRRLDQTAHGDQAARQIPPPERHREQETQRRYGAVDGCRTCATPMLVQPEVPQILRRRRVRRAAEEGRETPDVPYVVLLRMRSQPPDGIAEMHKRDREITVIRLMRRSSSVPVRVSSRLETSVRPGSAPRAMAPTSFARSREPCPWEAARPCRERLLRLACRCADTRIVCSGDI